MDITPGFGPGVLGSSPGGRTAMTTDELWRELKDHSVATKHVFGRPHILLPEEEFTRFEHCFAPQLAFFSRYENLRSSEWWRHVHAVKYGKLVDVHIDHCNPNVSFWLNIPHGIIDVLPYLVWCLLTRHRPFRL